MTAQLSYPTSALLLFSTFLERSGYSVELQLAAATIFKIYLEKVKPEVSITAAEFAEYCKKTSVQQEVFAIVKKFLDQYNPTQVRVFFHEFVQDLNTASLSHSTVKNYCSDIQQYLTYSGAQSLAELFSQSSLLAFAESQLSQELKESSVKRKLVSIGQFANWAEKSNLVANASQEVSLIAMQLTTIQTKQELKWYSDQLELFTAAQKTQLLSESTIKNYKSDISQLLSYSEKTGVENPLSFITLKTFIADQKQNDLKENSIKRKIVSFSSFYSWLGQQPYSKGKLGSEPNWELLQSITRLKPPENSAANQAVAKKSRWPLLMPSLLSKTQPAGQLASTTAQDGKITALYSTVKHLVENGQGKKLSLNSVLHGFITALLILGLSFLGYQQFITQAPELLAYPNTPVRPNRELSFQGRLTDTAQNPVTTPADMEFRLYDVITGGTELWNSGTCAVTPDQDGIFNVGLGDTCGAEISEDVFSENSSIWLEVEVETEILTPRQSIKTVPYALNSETVQGYPVSATGAATINTLLTMDSGGQILLAETAPSLKVVSGSFSIEAQALTLSTSAGSNGDIILNPDGTGITEVLSDLTSTGYITAPGATLSATYVGGTVLSLNAVSGATANILEWTNTSNLGAIDGNGNVGIGTNTPAFNLEVVGDAAIGTDLDVNQDLYLTRTLYVNASAGTSGQILTSAGAGVAPTWSTLGAISITDDSLDFSEFVDAMTLDATTTVAFGAFNYVHNLNSTGDFIIQDNGTPFATFADDGTFTLDNLRLDGNTLSSTTGAVTLQPLSGQNLNVTLGTTGDFAVNTNQLYVDTSSGNVGIGTTSPTQALEVAGNIFLNGGNRTISYQDNTASAGYDLTVSAGSSSWANAGAHSGDLYLRGGSTSNFPSGDAGNVYVIPGTNGLGDYGKVYIGDNGGTVLQSAGFSNTEVRHLTGGSTVITSLRAGTTKSVAGAAGLGTAIELFTTDDAIQDITISKIASEMTTATSGNVAGNLYFQTINNNSLTTKMLISPAGNVGIGTTAPGGLLDIGATSQFRVSSTGDITKIKDLAYSWPSSHTTDGVLRNDGSGNLTWATLGAAAITSDSLDFSEFVDAMTLDATTTVAFGGFDYIHNLNSTGDFIIQDNGTPFATFADDGTFTLDNLRLDGNTLSSTTGAVTLQPLSGQNLNVTLGTTGDFVVNTNQLYVDTSAGNVGIGTTVPVEKLHIEGNITARNSAGTPTISSIGLTNPYIFSQDTTNNVVTKMQALDSSGYIGTESDHDLYLITNNTQKLTVKNDGKVGIGTTSPLGLFHTTGAVTGKALAIFDETGDQDILTASASGTTRMRVANNGFVYAQQFADITDPDYFLDPADIDLSLTTAGNVGIGTTSPGQLLDVAGEIELANYLYFGNGSSEYLRWDSSNFILSDDLLAASDGGSSLGSDSVRWSSLYVKGSSLHIGDSGDDGIIGYDTTDNFLSFDANADATAEMFIEATGNVGIGVSGSTAARIHVSSGTLDNVASFRSSDDLARFEVRDNTTGIYFNAKDDYASIGGGNGLDAINLNIHTSTGNVGIGLIAPTQKLDIEAGNINIDNTTFANSNGIILKDGTRFIHNFNYGNNGSVTTVGLNTFAGLNSGNFTMGSTATQVYEGSYNTGFGQSTLSGVTIGSQNTAFGAQSLTANTTGNHNVAMGMNSMFYNTSGTGNVALGSSALVLNNGNYNNAIGYAALYNNAGGGSNIATGYAALYNNTSGSGNVANGHAALFNITTGSHNLAMGYNAGYFIADGVTANQTSGSSLYLGYNTKASANGNTNETVIGYNGTGLGSNTVVLGNDSVVTTALRGNVGIGTTAPSFMLDVDGTFQADTPITKTDYWRTMEPVPASTWYGAGLVYTGNNYMYALNGNNSTGFYRYNISDNTWSTMAVLPATAYHGGSLVYTGGDYIYALRGNSSTTFYRYSISGNSWTTMTAAPGSISSGSDMTYDGGDYIYALRGGATTAFYRYSIAGDSWSVMTVVPASVSNGGSIEYTGGNYMYAFRGNNTTTFYRYSISGNSWTAMTAAPGTIWYGGDLTYTGGNYIYALRGNGSEFYRYSIGTDSWVSVSNSINTVSGGGSLAYTGDHIYMVRGNISTIFQRYAVGGDTLWSSAAVGADLAEYFPTQDMSLQKGMLVSVDDQVKVERSGSAYDNKLLGIITTQPGTTLGKTVGNDPTALIALAGRVPTIITATPASIFAGDLITSSNIAGVGMKATIAGQTVGKTLESNAHWNAQTCSAANSLQDIVWPEDDGTNQAKPCFMVPISSLTATQQAFYAETQGLAPTDSIFVGKLMVFVSTNFADPSPVLEAQAQQAQILASLENGFELVTPDGSILTKTAAFAKATIAKITAGLVNTQDLIVQNTASIQDLSVGSLRIGNQTLAQYIASVVAGEVQDQQLAENLLSPEVIVATQSATASALSKLLVENATVTNNLTVEGTLLSQELVAETITATTVETTTLVAEELDVTSARISQLEANMAELAYVRATTAELMTATVSGTLYAETIHDFDNKVASALQQPSLLALLTGEASQQNTQQTEDSLQDLYTELETVTSNASSAAELNRTMADLSLTADQTVLGAAAVFVEQYFKVNGSAYVADSLGVGNNIFVENSVQVGQTRIADGSISYHSTNPNAQIFKIQPERVGSIELLAGIVTIDQSGEVTVAGNLTVAGAITAQDSLLTNLLKPTTFENPLQVQVAGVDTTTQEVKRSRFEIIDEVGIPVATFSAQGRAEFAGGISIASQDLGIAGENNELNTNATSGKAVISAGTNEVRIKSSQINANSLVYVTATGSTGNQVLYVKGQAAENPETPELEGQFSVGFDALVTQDVAFNWWVVN